MARSQLIVFAGRTRLRVTAEALFPRAAAKARYFEQFFRRVVAGHLIGPHNDGDWTDYFFLPSIGTTIPRLGGTADAISILSNKLPEHQRNGFA